MAFSSREGLGAFTQSPGHRGSSEAVVPFFFRSFTQPAARKLNLKGVKPKAGKPVQKVLYSVIEENDNKGLRTKT